MVSRRPRVGRLPAVALTAAAAFLVFACNVILDNHTGGFDAGVAAIIDASEGGCALDEKSCFGRCVKLDDPKFGCSGPCEACSLARAKPTCKATGGALVCAVDECSAGYGDCNIDVKDGCEKELSEDKACGACGIDCKLPNPFCGFVDGGYACVATCLPPREICSGECVNTRTNEQHCGGCGKVCPPAPNADPECQGSTCGIVCRSGFQVCPGHPGCVDPDDAKTCGPTCIDCVKNAPNNTNATCTNNGTCKFACKAGYANCDPQSPDCETKVTNDILHCGGCSPCRAGECCIGGRCVAQAVGTPCPVFE